MLWVPSVSLLVSRERLWQRYHSQNAVTSADHAVARMRCAVCFDWHAAQVRRGGQVQEAREKTAGYGGEATGIKSKVSKSRRF